MSATRLLLVARTRYELPLSPSLARKFDALKARFELRVLASAARPGLPADETLARCVTLAWRSRTKTPT